MVNCNRQVIATNKLDQTKKCLFIYLSLLFIEKTEFELYLTCIMINIAGKLGHPPIILIRSRE